MIATIYLDPQTIQPVIDGEWHRAVLRAIPVPGDEITVLCGATATATATVAFAPRVQQNAMRVATQCCGCDEIYRRSLGIPLQHGARR